MAQRRLARREQAEVSDVTEPVGSDDTPGPYLQGAEPYWRAGWQPIPITGKATNLPRGFTGHHGGPVDLMQVTDWIVNRPNDNVALRLNGIVGIDVDAYMKDGKLKRGDRTLELAEAEWGPLPATWRSTSRDASNPSGIRFYRVPPGDINLRTVITMVDPDTGDTVGDIEVIQYHHRYALVWPSIHPDTGGQYRWYTPEMLRATLGLVPQVDDLPDLPAGWLEALASGPSADARDYTPAVPQLAPRTAWHDTVEQRYRDGLAACRGEAGSRHDNVHKIVCALARDESRGRAGSTTAINLLRDQFDLAIADRDGEAEYDSMVHYARQLVATTVSTAEQHDELQRAVDEVFAGLPTFDPNPPAVATEPVQIDPAADDPFDGFGAWRPVDVTKYLDPSWQPEPPSLLTRLDGKALYYRRNVNWLHGASGEGKTWVALVAVAQEIQAHRDVLWVHYEDPEADKITHRLVLLGVPPALIAEYFHVVLVGAESMVKGIPFMRAITAYYSVDVVVIDSIGEAIGADGVAAKDDERLVKWLHDTARVLAADGCSVIGIDHLPMGEPGRLDPVGSFRKKAATTGAMFLAQSPRPPTKDQAGYITLTCAKDRSGVWTKGEVAALIRLTPCEGGVKATVEAPTLPKTTETDSDTMRAAKAAVRAVKARGDGQPYNRGQLEAVLADAPGKAITKRQGIDYAVALGWLVEDRGENNARIYGVGDLLTFEDDDELTIGGGEI